MQLVERFWTAVTVVVSFFSLSGIDGPIGKQQSPLVGPSVGQVHGSDDGDFSGPIFKPPGGRLVGDGSDFQCDYSPMGKNVVPCFGPQSGGCWLRNTSSGFTWDIGTNYEDTNLTPVGITRVYYLNITEENVINADGLDFPEGKFFNSTYPGPYIQGCWGDNITVIVTNKMKTNGTSVHWHGIRQWLTMHMDGVNGVTQCPIAPGDSFNYTWRAMQYGSSWYHSHYSVQYADGAVGPITLYGPSSSSYDEAKLPILMTDWGELNLRSLFSSSFPLFIRPHSSTYALTRCKGHNSAFEAVWTTLVNQSILLNGSGNANQYNNAVQLQKNPPAPYSPTFEKTKRYLFRLINTSFGSTFVFSIDNHILEIVQADFVPIQSYTNSSVLIGIGQRYHVIVTANPVPDQGGAAPTNGLFWIRTYQADCFGFRNYQIFDPKTCGSTASKGYEMTGILRYSFAPPAPALPSSRAWPVYKNVSLNCSDETYASLKPVYQWTVGKPPVNDPLGGVGENFTVQSDINGPSIYPLSFFSLENPIQVDYTNPTFFQLNNTGTWNPLWAVVPENYTAGSWVYLAFIGNSGSFGAHPIHLHGHDFAILQQVRNITFPKGLNLTYNNPPRRDVVLLPSDGYVVIAFKADNPGAWLVHCHIADHISSGLGLQIMERQNSAADIWPSIKTSHALQNAAALCKNWNSWWANCNNWWPGDGSSCGLGITGFQPDSGV